MPIHRFKFGPQVPFSDAEASLLLARWGTESLHGPARARLEARCRTDEPQRMIELDASSEAGQNMSRLFLGFLQQEFPASHYTVDVVDRCFEETFLDDDQTPSSSDTRAPVALSY